MDLITLTMAKKYSDSKGGYTKKVTITYDGKGTPEALENFEDSLTYVQIATGVYDLYEITKITGVASGTNFEIVPSFIATARGYICAFVKTDIGNVPTVVYKDGKLYGLHTDDMGYLTSVKFETIVPIDPKYLPGPKVIDLDSYGIGQVILGLFASGGGLQRLENVNNFWNDVNTDRVLRLVMKLMDDSIIIDQCVRTKLSTVQSVSFSFTGNYSGNMTTVSCCIIRETTDGVQAADIIIKVT